jgi:pimeloyl-ACP methyl ester carboxylesterase
VAVLPATEPGPAAATEPLLFLGGGPGEKTMAVMAFVAAVPGTLYAELRRTRDLVVLDQRGVGASRPALDCPEQAAARDPFATRDDAVAALLDATAACHARLTAAGIDLSAFDTAANVRDLDLVRAALGRERWHVFGTSYGARLAWQATRQTPHRLASVILSSPVPAEENFVADIPSSFSAALGGVVRACADDTGCAATYPTLAADLDTLRRRLAAQPLLLPVVDPATGATVAIPFDDLDLAAVLYTLFYFPGGPGTVPYVVTELARGNTGPLLTLPSIDAADVISAGMQLSFVCAEEIAYLDRAEFARNWRRAGPYGRAAWEGSFSPFARQCERWPVARGDREVFTPLTTDVPVLVVTGQFDQITPPAYGRTVHRQARHSRYVEVPGSGHSPLLAAGPCGVSLITAFTADPRVPLNTGCLPTAPAFAAPGDFQDPTATPAGRAAGGLRLAPTTPPVATLSHPMPPEAWFP